MGVSLPDIYINKECYKVFSAKKGFSEKFGVNFFEFSKHKSKVCEKSEPVMQKYCDMFFYALLKKQESLAIEDIKKVYQNYIALMYQESKKFPCDNNAEFVLSFLPIWNSEKTILPTDPCYGKSFIDKHPMKIYFKIR